MVSHNTSAYWPQMVLNDNTYQLFSSRIRKNVDSFPVENPLQRNGSFTFMLPHQTLWYEVAIDLIGPWSEETQYFNGEF